MIPPFLQGGIFLCTGKYEFLTFDFQKGILLLKEKGVNNGLSEIHLARYQTVTDHCCDFGLHGSWQFYLAAIAPIDMFAAQIFRKTLALCGNDQGLVRNFLPGCSSQRFLIFPHTKKHACFKSVFSVQSAYRFVGLASGPAGEVTLSFLFQQHPLRLFLCATLQVPADPFLWGCRGLWRYGI